MRIYKWVEMTLREIVHKRTVAADVDEEMRFHLAMQTEQNLRSGIAPDEARRDALLAFGGILRHQEVMRDEQPARRLERLAYDVRFALRMLRKTPAFTIAAVLTLAVGIGGNAAVFSALNGVVLHPLPYVEPDRLMSIAHTTKGGDLPATLTGSTATHIVYSSAKSFSAIAVYQYGQVTITGQDLPERAAMAYVTQSLFTVLGVAPRLGRVFTPEEDQPGAESPVVISESLWLHRFAGDRGVIGQAVVLNGHSHVIVGVMPSGFEFPSENTKLWLPMQIDVHKLDGFDSPEIGRLRPGVRRQDAQRELAALLPRVSALVDFLPPATLESMGLRPDVHPYVDEVVPIAVRRTLWMLWATVALVLLIACVNVASLLAVRAESRRREMSLRNALGAERGQLLAQSITESTVLVLLGTALGIAFASVALGLLRRYGADVLPRVNEVHIDGAVLFVTGLVVAGATLIFGAAPLVSHRGDGSSLIFGLGSRGGTTDLRGLRMRHALVIGQVAMASMLLVVCGLMVRTAKNLASVDLGFHPDSVVTFRVALPRVSYPTAKDVARFHEALLERIRSMPGVVAAGATSELPLTGTEIPVDPLRTDLMSGGASALPPVAEMRAATPGYFEALGIPLRHGRLLRDDDSEQASGAVLVTDALVRRILQGREPIGARVAHGLAGTQDARAWSQVVGVVGDVRGSTLEQAPVGAVYYPIVSAPGVNMEWLARQMSYAVRVRTQPMALLPAIRAFVHELDPALPLTDTRTLSAIVTAASGKTRFAMMGLTFAAVAGLLLGAIGLYGLLAFATAQRTREIGVRIALGARPAAMRISVLRQGLQLCGAGILLGLVVAFALRVAIRPMLYEVSASDPLTFIAVAAVLMLVGSVAAWIPANRAARLDPVLALRAD